MGGMDKSSESIRNTEWQHYLRQRREYYRGLQTRTQRGSTGRQLGDSPDDLTGLALSGGGIRSATFALGVLQALAHHDLLRRFDYLSTVSGGGYIGTSLTWLTSKLVADAARDQKIDSLRQYCTAISCRWFWVRAVPRSANGALDPTPEAPPSAPFPYGSDDPRSAREPDGSRAEGAMLRYLRQHGNYLTPGKGITLTSVIVVLFRGIILNLLVWIPIVAALMWLLIWLSATSSCRSRDAPDFRADHSGSALCLSWQLDAGSAKAFVGSISPPLDRTVEGSPPLFAFGIILTRSACSRSASWPLSAIPCDLYRPQVRQAAARARNTCWRRVFEERMRGPFWIIGVLLLLAVSVPFVGGGLHGWLLGPRSPSVGLSSGVWPSCETMQQPKSGPKGRPAAPSPAAGSPRSARPSCSTASCWCPTPSVVGGAGSPT